MTDCPGVFGSVRYGFGGIERPSLTMPEALHPFHGLSWEDIGDYRLFFHKHEFYRFEDEYRIILCSSSPMRIPIPVEIVESVIVSPFSSDSGEMIDVARDFCGDRVQRSRLPRPY